MDSPGLPIHRGPRAGFTALEVACAVAVLLVAALGFARALVSARELERAARERARAAALARSLLEQLFDADFETLLPLYDADPANDPGGPGTAPGATFALVGTRLRPCAADEAGELSAEVRFPLVEGELREDVDWPEFGLPLDLDGDGAIDVADHRRDHQLLPVRTRVTWRGARGTETLELRTLLCKR